MAETIADLVIHRSGVASAIPPIEILNPGELAINYRDGKLFYRDHAGAIQIIGKKDSITPDENTTFTGTLTFGGNNTFTGTNSFSSSTQFLGVATFSSVAMTTVTLDDGVIEWDAEDGNLAIVSLTQNSTLAGISNVSPGSYILRLTQDGTGGHELAFGPNFKSAGGAPIEISLDPDAISILTIVNIEGDDLYVIAQSNFTTFGNGWEPGEGDIPNAIIISGATPTDINGTYYRAPNDSNDNPTWILIDSESDIEQFIIRSDSLFYIIEHQTREDADDTDWVSDGGAQYEVTSEFEDTYQPWLATWQNTENEYTGDITVEAMFEPPAYVFTFSLYPTLTSGDSVQFFATDISTTWNGTDAIPAGTIYRAINPAYPTIDSRRYLYLAPRDNDVGGQWKVGLWASTFIFELMDQVMEGGPLGTYESQDEPTTRIGEITAFEILS
jgi:hypothetical protein